jgi:hypothetical protein
MEKIIFVQPGKDLLEWLEGNTDFESREDCRRFLKSLLKLNFMRCNQNEFLRFDPVSRFKPYLTCFIAISFPLSPSLFQLCCVLKKRSKCTLIPNLVIYVLRWYENSFQSSEYWFYLTRLKEDLPKTRKISKTLMSEGRKPSVQEKTSSEKLARKQSVIGLTPDLIQQLTTFQSSKSLSRVLTTFQSIGVIHNN